MPHATDADDPEHSEEALDRARVALTRVSRVTTLGELAASIAHDVSQPLTAMVADASACLNLLSRPQPDLELLRESLRAIVNDGARAGEMLARVRARLTRSAIDHQRCSIGDVVLTAVSLARPELSQHGVEVEISLGEHVAVRGDPLELQQALVNLLLNAGEAARDLEAPRRRMLVSTSIEGEGDATRVTVAVRDSGVGIDETALEQMFSAFYTTKPEGLGMGLAISRSIIERHRGRLWGSRNPNHGATFAFSLPAMRRPSSR